jgi:23S rRNA (uracil1939-C5)-methyltransferase
MDEGPAKVECEHAERCGGCPAIELPYIDQLSLKRGRVVSALARYGSLELVYADPVIAADPVIGYRRRAKLMVGPRGAIGLFAKGGGHDVIDVPKCRVLSPVVARVVAAVRARVQHDARSGGPLAPQGASGGLRAIDVRELDGGEEPRALLTLVVHRGLAADLDPLREVAASLLAEVPEVVGVAASLHDGESPQVLGGETVLLAGASEADDRIGKCVHVATFGSFVQAHRVQAARIHDILATHLKVHDAEAKARVVDLYSGSGAIALALGARGADVTCVEAFGPAAARIERAATKSGLRVHAMHSDVASALRTFGEHEAKFDAAVVNPPRRGVGPAAREHLARLAPAVIGYVSCDPDTLARDLDHFARLGYRCASAQPLDMIPLSDEVETVAILRRAPVPPPRVLFEDDTCIFVDKAAHEPTTPQGEYASSLLDRVRLLPNAKEAVPVHRLDIGTSGVVLFARTPKDVAAWQRGMTGGSARKVYLAATRGVLPTKGSVTRDLRDGDTVQPARTKYRRLSVFSGHCVARVMPEQGRTHQIRRHLSQIGHPVLGDERYGHAPTNRHFEEKYGLDRTFLHCVRFELEHPQTQARLVVESPLPGDLQTVLERAGGPGTLRFLDQKNALGRNTSSYPPPSSTGSIHIAPPPSRESGSDGRLVRADIVSDEDDPTD